MKKIFLLLGVFVLAISSFGQGSVTFHNSTTETLDGFQFIVFDDSYYIIHPYAVALAPGDDAVINFGDIAGWGSLNTSVRWAFEVTANGSESGFNQEFIYGVPVDFDYNGHYTLPLPSGFTEYDYSPSVVVPLVVPEPAATTVFFSMLITTYILTGQWRKRRFSAPSERSLPLPLRSLSSSGSVAH